MPIQTSFNAGEFSDLMGGDVDLQKRAFSVSLLQNMIALKQGPAVTRGPTSYIGEVKDSSNRVAIRRFEFSDRQSYIIEIGDEYFRFYKEYALIESVGVPVELVTPYAQADLFDTDGIIRLNFAQSADVLYIVHPSYPPMSLTRTSDTVWTLTEILLDDGPYFDINSTATTITPSGTTGSVTLTASAATFVSTDVGRAVRVRHGSSPTYTWGWALITAVTVPAATAITGAANNGSGLIRITSTSHGLSTGHVVDISGVTGTTEANGTWTVTVITANTFDLQSSAFANAYISGGTVTATKVLAATATVTSAFGATTASAYWRLGMFSDTTGYPSTVTFHQDRVCVNGPSSSPDYYALSKTSGYSSGTLSFQPTNAAGTVADDNGIVGRVPSGQVNDIRWMISDMRGLVIGTGKEEFLVRASSLGDALTPTNVTTNIFSATGGSALSPIRTMSGSAFVQEARRRVFDIIYSYESDSLKPQDLTLASEHITRGQLIDAAYQKEPVNVIWFVRGDGILVGMTHYPDQEVYGWHRHIIGGTDAAVESIACIPSPDGKRDDLWLVVRRTINGVTKRYIEYMKRYYEDDMSVSEGARCDCGMSYSGAATDTVSGLDYLEGETVKVMVDGKAHPDLVVSGGEVVLANGRTGTDIKVGLPYTWRLVTREPEIKLSNGDTAQGKVKRISDVVLRLLNTLGLSYGGYGKTQYEYSFEQGHDFDETPVLFSGDTDNITWSEGSGNSNKMEFSSDSVFPACIVAIMYKIKVMG